MAEVDTGGGEEGKKGKPKKMNLRVDFTPMVDMNMLLITFFMFCTTLSKPQAMDLVLPTNNQEIKEEDQNKVPDDKVITILLASDNQVYYYFGKPDYENYGSLHKTNYEGMRSMLLERNKVFVQQMINLRKEKSEKKITEEEYRQRARDIRNDKNGQIVIIKPTEGATYKNLVATLDEMQITSIGKYAIVDPVEGDEFLIENYESRGGLTEASSGNN